MPFGFWGTKNLPKSIPLWVLVDINHSFEIQKLRSGATGVDLAGQPWSALAKRRARNRSGDKLSQASAFFYGFFYGLFSWVFLGFFLRFSRVLLRFPCFLGFF